MEMTEQLAQRMRTRGFEVAELSTAAEARDYLLKHILGDASVGVGGSVTIRDLDVLDALTQKGCAVYDPWKAAPEDKNAAYAACMTADTYLVSANAITADGRLVLVDGRGNRVGAVVYGPKRVYFVVSRMKLVDGGINTAIARVKQTACPQNARRLGLDTACARAESCKPDACENSMCRITVVLDRAPMGREMTVLLVDEALGY